MVDKNTPAGTRIVWFRDSNYGIELEYIDDSDSDRHDQEIAFKAAIVKSDRKFALRKGDVCIFYRSL